MEKLQHQDKVILVLGTCRKYGNLFDVDKPTCATEQVVSALQMQGYKVLLVDLRKTCRRATNDSGCLSFQSREAALLTMATALELQVAMDHFGIKFHSVVTFGEVSGSITEPSDRKLMSRDSRLGFRNGLL